jgi:hypothetical protein
MTNRNDTPIMLGSPAQDVANFVGEKKKVLAIHQALARSTLGADGRNARPTGAAIECEKG